MTAAESPRVWLFDFDGTLARLEAVVNWPAARAEVRELLKRAGAPPEVTGLEPPRALGMYDAYRAHLEEAAPQARERGARVLRQVSKFIEKRELADADRAEPLPGALELLRAIGVAAWRTGIVTSNSAVTVERWLRRHEVRDAIEVIVGRDSGLALKPDPAALLRALELLGGDARDAVLVGDSEADLRAAIAARIRFVGIAADTSGRDRLIAVGAEEVYSSPAALAIHRGPPVRGITPHR